MDSSPFLAICIIMYLVFFSTAVAVFATGMGYGGVEGINVNYDAPDEESFWSSIPIVGSVIDTSSFSTSVIKAVFTVLVWTLPEAFFPAILNVLMIKIPIVGLILTLLDVFLP